MRTRVGVLALSVVLSAGCGKIKEVNSDAGPEPDAMPEADAAPPDPCAEGGEPTFEEAVTCVKSEICELFSRCFAPFEEGQCDENVPFTLFGERSQFNEHAIAEAIEAGIIEFDPAGVAACLAFFRETSCADFAQLSGQLTDFCPVLSGTVADGDDCVIDYECATPHAVCSEVTKCDVEDYCCVRGCVAPSPVDGPCDDSEDALRCEPGDHCVFEVCRNGEDSAQCSLNSDCDLGLWCEDGSCRPEVASGAECYNDEQCPGPETCLGNNLEGGKIAWVCGRSDREGDRCDGSCNGFDCDQPSQSELGTCVPYLQEEGADCSVRNCALPSWTCDNGADQCVPRIGVGEVCSASVTEQCQFGLICTRFITGEPTGVCTGPQADGERCDDDDECRSGVCSGGGPDEQTCQPYPGCYE